MLPNTMRRTIAMFCALVALLLPFLSADALRCSRISGCPKGCPMQSRITGSHQKSLVATPRCSRCGASSSQRTGHSLQGRCPFAASAHVVSPGKCTPAPQHVWETGSIDGIVPGTPISPVITVTELVRLSPSHSPPGYLAHSHSGLSPPLA